MIAVDTNILTRALVKDDPAQARLAERVLLEEDVWVPITVVLELEWVLRGNYKYDRSRVAEAMTRLFGLPNVRVQAHDAVAAALSSTKMDFADALHRAMSDQCDGLMTFDKAFIAAASEGSGIPVHAP